MSGVRAGQLGTRRERRRILTGMVIRCVGVVALLTGVYALLPFDRIADVPLWLLLPVGILVLTAVAALQMRSVLRSSTPALRAIEALTVTVTLFLLLFASCYAVLSRVDEGSFDLPSMTRTDALYFTVTVFSTVGFGDLSPVSQGARVIVTIQMVLDLLLVGLGIRALVGVVNEGRQRVAGESGAGASVTSE